MKTANELRRIAADYRNKELQKVEERADSFIDETLDPQMTGHAELGHEALFFPINEHGLESNVKIAIRRKLEEAGFTVKASPSSGNWEIRWG